MPFVLKYSLHLVPVDTFHYFIGHIYLGNVSSRTGRGGGSIRSE